MAQGLLDQNIIPDLSQVPPLHQNPFARGQIVGGTITAGGSGYTSATASITTSTGSGAVLEVVINTTLSHSGGSLVASGGPVSAIIVQDPGYGYCTQRYRIPFPAKRKLR